MFNIRCSGFFSVSFSLLLFLLRPPISLFCFLILSYKVSYICVYFLNFVLLRSFQWYGNLVCFSLWTFLQFCAHTQKKTLHCFNYNGIELVALELKAKLVQEFESSLFVFLRSLRISGWEKDRYMYFLFLELWVFFNYRLALEHFKLPEIENVCVCMGLHVTLFQCRKWVRRSQS